MKKIIFIDGDLVDFENLTSASLGIKQARKKGHLVYLYINKDKLDDSILSVGFDGIFNTSEVDRLGAIKQAINSSNISIGDVITFGNSPIEKITNYVFDNNDELYNCFIKLNLIESIQPKAIMCDVDGTLLSSNGLVLKDTIEAIKKLRKQE